MSDLSMYELEDIIWDDFNQDEDHIVPHLTNTGTPKNPFQRDTYKKFGKNLDKNKNMMEKESFNPSYDVEIVKDTCEDTRMPDKCFKKSYAMSAPGDNDNSYSYPLTHISESEDLYYGWPDIGTFEDVDNMLRSCDSSFGLENDEWFTNDQIGGGLNNNILPEGYLMDSCGDLSFEGGTVSENDDKKQGFKPLFVESPKQKGMSLEIGSLNVPETSSISSELDEISLEATSFRHLQQIMEQLDLRTKLCIRDSLYRLASSAEQRHINPLISNEIGGPLMAERSDTGLMDMETDTNPIDRSVAHLLFHRPSESPKINAKQGSMKVEKVCEEEANVK